MSLNSASCTAASLSWFACFAVGCLIGTSQAVAQSSSGIDSVAWSSFQNGGQAISSLVALPTQWSNQSGIAWQASIEGYGQSSPVVMDDRVFVTSTSGPNKENYHLQAFNLADGTELWQRDFANPSPEENSSYVSRAAPTPVVDTKGIVVLFEGGLLVGLNLTGETRWETNLVEDYGPIKGRHGIASSLEQTEEFAFVWIERSEDPYLYGGHTGEAHSYSTEAQSNQLLKLDLQTPTKAWEKVTEGERLQGLALVEHGKHLICIGGFTALNAPGADHNLHSRASVREFDTQSQTWSDLPALPVGRSSHDAAIIGDTIYVVGGWTMNGDDDTQWHTTAHALDLSQANSQWTEIAAPPFKRRALATASHAGKLYVIGGMNEEGGPTREVAVFDPSQNAWTNGPTLVGEKGMEGFGVSAWSIDGRLIATTYSGTIQQLSDSGDHWTVVGRTRDARFFHRLLPIGDNMLISVGGANMEQHKKFLDPEIVAIPVDAAVTSSKETN